MSDAWEEVQDADEQADEAWLQRVWGPPAPVSCETCGRCFEAGLSPGECCPTCGDAVGA